MSYGVVYIITNLTNGRYYIGQTVQGASQRFQGHLKDCLRKTGPLQRAIQKYGPAAFVVEDLAEGSNAEELNKLESLWIAITAATQRGIGYNCRTGGDSQIPNAETRAKLSRAQTGKKQSPEMIEKRRQASIGKKRSGVALANLIAGARKRSAQLTPEQRQAMSDRLKKIATGREPANKGKKGIQVAWNKGRKCSEDERIRMREMRVKQVMTPERKARISATMKGRMPAVNLMGRAPWNKGHRKAAATAA